MKDEQIILHSTPEKDLLPCPHCGGAVKIVGSGAYPELHELWSAKFRCEKCGGLYEYNWRSDPWTRTPPAVEWWNTRAETPPWTVCGYDLQQLVMVAKLLEENEISTTMLQGMYNNMASCMQIVEREFIKKLDQQLQTMLATRGGA